MATTLRVPQSRWDGKLTREFSASATGSIYFSTSKTLGITEGWFVIDPTNTNAEMMYLTNITGSAVEYTATVSMRGLREYGTDTNISGNQKPHRVSSRIIISDNHNWLQQIITAFNTHEDLVGSFHGVAGIGTTASRPSASSNSGKVYFSTDDLIAYFSDGTTWNAQSAGTQPDAGVSVKGVTKLTVAPVSATEPIAVGDNDPRMISAANVTDLTDGGETTLHYHNSDRARSNHTGYQSSNTIRETAIAGETLAVNDYIFINTGDGKAYKASKDISTYSNAWNVCGIVTTGGNNGDTVVYQILEGEYTYASAHGYTIGSTLYLSTGGTLTTTRPAMNSSTIVPMIVAVAVTSTKVQFRRQRLQRRLFTQFRALSASDVTIAVGFPISHVSARSAKEGVPVSVTQYFSDGYYDVIANDQDNNINGNCLVCGYTDGGTQVASWLASVSSNNLVLTWTGNDLPSSGVFCSILEIYEAL